MSGSLTEKESVASVASPLMETQLPEEIFKDSIITVIVPAFEESSQRRSCLCGHGDIVVALVAGLVVVSVGMGMGYSNPALQDRELTRLLGDETERRTWFASLLAIGAIFGSPCAGLLVDVIGRKLTLMICALPMAAGWFLIACGVNFAVLYTGRILCGFAVGMAILTAPLYIAETASKARRGVLGAGSHLAANCGIMAVYGIGIPLGWSWLAVVCMSICSLNVILILILPESPRWYAKQKRRREAIDSLAWLANEHSDVRKEYEEIERSIGSQPKNSFSLRQFSLPANYRPALISFGMMFFQQMSGFNIVIFYSSQIFATAGYADDPKTPTIIIGAALVAATVVSCILVDRAGRRILLLVSGVVMTISITAIGVYYYLTLKQGYSLSWLPLTSVLVYVVFYSLGWGPVPSLIILEIVPTRVRGLVNGLAMCITGILLFLVTKEFESLRFVLNDYGTFWFFGGFCLLSCVIVGLFVPETKGRTLEEIEEHFT